MYVLIGEDKRVYGVSDNQSILRDVVAQRNLGCEVVTWTEATIEDSDVLDIIGCSARPIICGLPMGRDFAYYIIEHEVIK